MNEASISVGNQIAENKIDGSQPIPGDSIKTDVMAISEISTNNAAMTSLANRKLGLNFTCIWSKSYNLKNNIKKVEQIGTK